ncbi:MAG: hypothetical protein PVG07_06695, partial [Acidobacteriota bacterium]
MDRAVRRLHLQPVAGAQILQEGEVGVPVAGDDRVARGAGQRGAGQVSRPPGQGPPARPGQ